MENPALRRDADRLSDRLTQTMPSQRARPTRAQLGEALVADCGGGDLGGVTDLSVVDLAKIKFLERLEQAG